MKIRDIAEVIERYAPLRLQESYDNAGLIVGRPEDEVHQALLAVDVTEEVLDEAEQTGCDLIVTHHPIVFHALKRFNSATYVERCVERAIRRGIALYACHTNLDSAPGGMSWRLAEMLGVEELRVLQPTDPADGRVGFGVVGELPQSMSVRDFMRRIQERLPVQVIRHSELVKEQVRRVDYLHRSGSLAARRSASCAGRCVCHFGPQIQRFYDSRRGVRGGRYRPFRERILRNRHFV